MCVPRSVARLGRPFFTASLCALALAATACANDDGSLPEGFDAGITTPCTLEPKLSAIYADVFHTGTCNTSGCHQGDFAAASMGFDKTKDQVYAELTSDKTDNALESAKYPKRVVAGDPTKSYLYLRLTAATAQGRMPPTGALSACRLDAIKNWIVMGAMND